MEARSMPLGRSIVESNKAAAAGAIESRRLMWAVAEVCWADPSGHPVRSRATIVDISISGACIRLKDRIGIGSRLTITWRREQFSAIARNCRADGQDYLLGVRRDSSPVSEAERDIASAKPAPLTALAPSALVASDKVDKSVRSALPEPAREPAAALKTIPLPITEKRAGTVVRKTPRSPNLESVAPRPRREAADQERKVMQPKPFFPKFWRGQHETDAPTKVAPKETTVNKTSTHIVEQVSEPPALLLSYEDIYHAAGIMNPRSGYGIRKVVEMLNSERIRDLSKDIQRASVLMALDAAGATVDDLLDDATRRQDALNSYEQAQRQQLDEFEKRKTQENAQIEAEMQRITAHYADRMKQNKDEVTKHKEALHDWQMAKQSESQRISEVLELCGKHPAAPASTMAAAAGAGATQSSDRSLV